MAVPHKKQSIQDIITQQWVILFGRKINPTEQDWLLGPFGDRQGVGYKFIHQLTEKENLTPADEKANKGLIQSIRQLNLAEQELSTLSKEVIDFYENTSQYNFELKIKWNPFFKFFGRSLKLLFSNRIEQLNIPIENEKDSNALKSEIIQLLDAKTKTIKRTIWLRSVKETQQVVYAGVYETCRIPSGKTCIKAIFPLPNGNATVILIPSVGKNGELILKSAGKKFGDSGFYFLLNDSKERLWAKYVRTFKDTLVAQSIQEKLIVTQTFTLWGLRVLTFIYDIKKLDSHTK